MPDGWICVPSWKSRCIFYSYAYLDDSSIPLDTKLSTEELDKIAITGARFFKKELERLSVEFIFKEK